MDNKYLIIALRISDKSLKDLREILLGIQYSGQPITNKNADILNTMINRLAFVENDLVKLIRILE